jgi:hypothetical protein
VRVNRKADIQSFLTVAHWGQNIFDRELVSDSPRNSFPQCARTDLNKRFLPTI